MTEESVEERYEKKYGERFEEGKSVIAAPLEPVPLEPIQKAKKGGRKAVIAGVFLIFAGIFAVLAWLGVILFGLIEADLTFQTVVGVWITIFAIMALVGGILAVARRSWKLAVICSIFGLLTVIGAPLCAVGMIILLLAKKEFR